jgi:integrase
MARNKRPFGTIRKLPSGRYQALYTDAVGARVSAPATFTARATAERWLADRRAEVESGRFNPRAVQRPTLTTFGEYATGWLAGRQVGGRPIKPRTREHYADLLDHHLIPAFGSKPLAAITAADVRAWHASTLADRPTLRSHCYGLLRTIMSSALDDELIPANPARITGAGRVKRAVTIRPATIEELGALTEAMPERLRLMVLLASWCALRFGELIELRRDDIDVDAELIRVRRGAVRTKDGYQVGSPKSDAGLRNVSIPPHIMPMVTAHLADYVGPDRDSPLFPAEGGGHMQPSTLYRSWYRARAAAGRPDLRFHDLRHTGATLAAATGASLAELMARLGHSTPAAAMRYQHASAGRDREIAALLSKLADVP